ncbi:unnamed protein product [Closterium sp. NIES-54]
MDSRRLRFDAEGRPIDFDTLLRRTQHYLTSQRQDGATLYAHVSGALQASQRPEPLPAVPTPTSEAQADYPRLVLVRDSLVSSARDALLQQHPSELTIDLLETTLGKIESHLLSVASATNAVSPRLFEGLEGKRVAVVTVAVVPQAEGALKEVLTHLMEEVRPAAVRGPSSSSHSSSSHSRDSSTSRDSSSGRHQNDFSRGDHHYSGVRSSTKALRHSGDLEDPGALAVASALPAGPLAPRGATPAPATTGASPDRAVPVALNSTTPPCPVVPSGVLRGLHIPSFIWNLVGVRYLQDRGITFTFVGGGRTAVCTEAATGDVLATFTRESRSGLYVLHTDRSPVASSIQVAASPQVPVSSPVAVSGLPRIFPSLPPSLAPPCIPCVAGCLRATPHSSSLRPATAPFQTLHLDVLGPAPMLGLERERYFLVVVDDYSRYTMVFPLAKNYGVTSTLIRWLLVTDGTRGNRAHCLHSNRGGEFCSGVLAGFCGEQGIRQSWTLPESPQQNGVAERRIGLVMDIARMSMIHALFGLGPLVLGGTFTSRAALRLSATTLQQVTVDSVGVGARGAAAGGTRSRGARLRGARDGGAGAGGASSGGAGAGGAGNGGASFGGAEAGGAGAVGAGAEETGAGGSPTASPTTPPHRQDTRFQTLRRLEREEQEQLEQERQELHRCPPRAWPSSPLADLRTVLFRSPPCRSPLVSILPSPLESSLTVSSHPITDYYRVACPVVSRVLASLVTDPRASPSSVSALTAAVADFASTRGLEYATRVVAAPPPRPLSVGGTYVDAVPPPRANVVNGMWLFKVKRPPGSPPVFKARYVARGFSQREGVDFFQTITPTPKMTTLQMLLHVAAHRDYELHSIYFSTAFLQGQLHEEIWLRRPHGFTDTFPPGTQWSLRQPVYGLRQSPREWHDALRSTLRDLGFRTADSSLFVRTGSTHFFILVLGVGAVSWRSTRSSSVATSSAEAEIYAGAMAAQELRWLTFLLADLGERPRSASTLYADNKAMILLCREPQHESRVKHIDVR